jgi:pimeloyl-ACP methyl ester carboxylesterase
MMTKHIFFSMAETKQFFSIRTFTQHIWPTSELQGQQAETQLLAELNLSTRQAKVEQIPIGNQQYINTLWLDDSAAEAKEISSPPPGKKTLVITHGFGAGLGFFFRNYPALISPRLSVYSIDWLGMGRSSRHDFPKIRATDLDRTKKAEDYFVESLERWRQALNIESMTLAGHSLGGYLSAVYAERYPERVDKLILISPVGIPDSKLIPTRQIPTWAKRMWEFNFTPQWIIRTSGPLGINHLIC